MRRSSIGLLLAAATACAVLQPCTAGAAGMERADSYDDTAMNSGPSSRWAASHCTIIAHIKRCIWSKPGQAGPVPRTAYRGFDRVYSGSWAGPIPWGWYHARGQ